MKCIVQIDSNAKNVENVENAENDDRYQRMTKDELISQLKKKDLILSTLKKSLIVDVETEPQVFRKYLKQSLLDIKSDITSYVDSFYLAVNNTNNWRLRGFNVLYNVVFYILIVCLFHLFYFFLTKKWKGTNNNQVKVDFRGIKNVFV